MPNAFAIIKLKNPLCHTMVSQTLYIFLIMNHKIIPFTKGGESLDGLVTCLDQQNVAEVTVCEF